MDSGADLMKNPYDWVMDKANANPHFLKHLSFVVAALIAAYVIVVMVVLLVNNTPGTEWKIVKDDGSGCWVLENGTGKPVDMKCTR